MMMYPPPGTTAVTIAGVSVDVSAGGPIEIPEDLVRSFRTSGFSENPPISDSEAFTSVASTDGVLYDSVLSAENESLRARVIELEETVAKQHQALEALRDAGADAGATDVPDSGVDSSGGTSSSTGGTASSDDHPDFDEMSRDQLVSWVDNNGGSIANNVSKTVALAAAKDLFASKNK